MFLIRNPHIMYLYNPTQGDMNDIELVEVLPLNIVCVCVSLLHAQPPRDGSVCLLIKGVVYLDVAIDNDSVCTEPNRKITT